MPVLKQDQTDCVYFLASPLTCTKGSSCEFRHSEAARLNPKDCWYWSAGKCGNPNCPFRHPPLDGHSSTTTRGRHAVPCFYFRQGYCAKGVKCAYRHAGEAQSAFLAEHAQIPLKHFETNDCKNSNGYSIRRSQMHQNESKQDAYKLLTCGALVGDANLSSSARTCLSIEMQQAGNKATDASSTMRVTPDSGAPRRLESNESAAPADSTSNQMHPLKDTKLAPLEEGQEAFLGGQVLHDHRSVASPDHIIRHRDCIKTEEVCEESSFDVIVGDANTDKLPHDGRSTYAGKGEALSHHEHSQHCVQDSETDYESCRNSNFSEKNLNHNYLIAPSDHLGSPIGKKAPQNGQELVYLNGQQQRIHITNKDLRFHIIENRKTVQSRSLNVGDDFRQLNYCHGSFMKNGLQSHQRYNRYPVKDVRLNGGQDACTASMQNPVHYRELEQRWNMAPTDGAQRPYHREGRVFCKRLRQYAAERLYSAERWFDDADFASNSNDPALVPLPHTPMPWQRPVLRSCISTAPHHEALYGSTANTCRLHGKFERSESSASSLEFEGPKPLSVLLKEKRKRLAISEGAKVGSILQTAGSGGTLASTSETLGISVSSRIPEFECPKPECVPLTDGLQELAAVDCKPAKVHLGDGSKLMSSAPAVLEVISATAGLPVQEAPNKSTSDINAVNTELSLSLSYSARQDDGGSSASVDES